MEIDFRKQFESPGSASEMGSMAGTGLSPAAVPAASEAEDPTAVTFPLNWFARLVQYAFVAGAFGFVAHTAFYGDPERDFWKILVGCALVLGFLAFLPGSILLDSRGVHQVYLMGLYEYTIPKNAILSYQQTTRAELRREGKLWFSQWNRHRYDRDGEHEQVVIVNSRYGGRYILHGMMHSGQYRFMEELEKRGVPSHGYEGWNQFMAERGFPPEGEKR